MTDTARFRYADPHAVLRLGEARLTRFLHRHSRGAFGEPLTERILAANSGDFAKTATECTRAPERYAGLLVMNTVLATGDVPAGERTPLEVLRTDSATFEALTESRRNRRDDWTV